MEIDLKAHRERNAGHEFLSTARIANVPIEIVERLEQSALDRQGDVLVCKREISRSFNTGNTRHVLRAALTRPVQGDANLAAQNGVPFRRVAILLAQ